MVADNSPTFAKHNQSWLVLRKYHTGWGFASALFSDENLGIETDKKIC